MRILAMHTIHLQHVEPCRYSSPWHLVGSGESRLAAFLIIEIAVSDPEVYAHCREAASRHLAAAGATYLVRGGVVGVLAGDWRPNRMVVVRFDSADHASPMVE